MTIPFQSAEERAAWVAEIVDSSDDAIISETLDGVITSWLVLAVANLAGRTG